MKKRIGFIVLLIAVAAGMAFAQSGRYITVNASANLGSANADLAFWIESVTQTTVGIKVTYGAESYVNKNVELQFSVDFDDGKPSKSWTTKVKIDGRAKNKSFSIGVLNCYHISKVFILW